ncbi:MULTISPECIES: hypothetical protein [Kordiimonas]|jgi:adenylate kinase family enzyme|uniref:hypothetical protein n=1 Tax=Kordiimonas TaxID=288021 RepID=UPI0025808287|nr:hypothetical protein [Kordiimonas sp. UBA4487]
MKRVMVFGKPGGGKSSLAKYLAAQAGLPLHPLDLIQYRQNGEMMPRHAFLEAHQEVIDGDAWVVDGLGTLETFWRRVDAADTLVYVDLPYARHYWWVTKRWLVSLWRKPEGWPEGASVWKGTLASWRFLRKSPLFWNDALLEKLEEKAAGKRLIHVRAVRELKRLGVTFKG